MSETIMDHCRKWYRDQNINIDILPDTLQVRFYECYVNYAFAGFFKGGKNEYGIKAGKVYMAGLK